MLANMVAEESEGRARGEVFKLEVMEMTQSRGRLNAEMTVNNE